MTRLRMPAIAGLALLFTTGLVAPGRSQEPLPTDAAIIEEALNATRTEGPAAGITLLEARRDSSGLSPQATEVLGTLLVEAGRGEEALLLLEPMTRSESAAAPLLFHTWRAAMQTGQGAEKIDLLERAVALDSVSPAGRELGLIRGRQGRLRDAYLLLRPWVEAFPDDRPARLAAAVCAVELKRIPDAEKLLEDLPREAPQVGILWGKVLMERGDPYGAMATLKALPEDLPPAIDLDRRRTLALAHMSVGQSAEAVELLTGRAGNNPGVTLLLSQAQSQSGDVAGALETVTPMAQAVLEEPSALRPDLAAGLLVDYGRLLIGTGGTSAAIAPLQLAADLDPNNKLAFQSLGQSLAAAGRTEEAQAALERFNQLTSSEVPMVVKSNQLEDNVEDPTGRQLREAMRLLNQGRAGEALQIAQAEQDLASGDPRPLLIQAQILLFLGRAEDALAASDSAVAVAPDNPDSHYQRAVVLMDLDRLADAENEYRQALDLAEAYAPAMNDLAVLLMTQGRDEEARVLLERALEINPDDPLAASNLEQLSEG